MRVDLGMVLLLFALTAQWPATLDGERGSPSTSLPYGLSAGLVCRLSEGIHVCSKDGQPVRALRPHTEPVAGKGAAQWLRVSGLEWQAFYAEPLGHVRLGGQSLEVTRFGHPHAPHSGWEVAGWTPTQTAGPKVGRASLSKSPLLTGETQAAARMVGCPLVPLERFPVALLFDDSGTLRMLRLQGLPEQPLSELDLACVASAMEGLQASPGTKLLELQLSLL